MKLGFLVLTIFTIDFFTFYGGVCTTQDPAAALFVQDASQANSGIVSGNTTLISNTVQEQSAIGTFFSYIFPDYLLKALSILRTVLGFLGAPLAFLSCMSGIPTMVSYFISGVWILLTSIAVMEFIRSG